MCPACSGTWRGPGRSTSPPKGACSTSKTPGHDPAEFLWLLVTSFFPILREPLRSTLPPVFDGVELSPMEPRAERDADGNLTGYLENGQPIGFDT